MPQRRKISKVRATDDYRDAAAALTNQGDSPYAMQEAGAGSAMFPSMGGHTRGAGLSRGLVERLAEMQQKGGLTLEELRDILMAKRSLDEATAPKK